MNQCLLNRRTVIELAEYTIRQGNIEDAAALAAVEAECFPKAEAATAEEIRERLSVYPNHFLLLYRDGKLVGFIDGMTTEEKNLQDEMYEDASLHNERALADDFRAEYHSCLPQAGLCRQAYRSLQETGPGRRKKGYRPYLQGQTGSLLCRIRLCQ